MPLESTRSRRRQEKNAGDAHRPAGGTDGIMANIIAERVLGLPQDVRLDKCIPFNEVPTGAGKN
jgi:hypothetical protein